MRDDIINKIVAVWRDAESVFITTEDDTAKHEAQEYEDSHNLTPEEIMEVQKRCCETGV